MLRVYSHSIATVIHSFFQLLPPVSDNTVEANFRRQLARLSKDPCNSFRYHGCPERLHPVIFQLNFQFRAVHLRFQETHAEALLYILENEFELDIPNFLRKNS